ncbi:isocitrate lyase/phosphoenolpyruvate mutase family protein [Amycolatopsis sp. FBCC-B4732]|uniref:isocitrate lyase/PEP mutase family protein n=1 Tax=Amycolatopsis sp. FBCC-B4732 TaxID=3079339 RepID=UPI001FF47FF0|nr:isocitrate lyase/phosphoenolpyruvate mutase family protein [Amycolatopsis sp. FBCC-B4732]UOX90002.1 isocitrate lyase/phosphoenolpyruvate mutase family protein [Amycolatopsis sp. FBCC-B4732]
MSNGSWSAKAKLFRAAHDGKPLLLANAWDAASAVVVAATGAKAIATSSAGVAWSQGYRDGERIPAAEMAAAVRRITRVVDLPVTADIEAGYGPDPADVAATVTAIIHAGAVGVNLEDSRRPGGPLFDVAAQCARIRAAKDAAAAAGCPELFVNARTDGYLFAIGDPAGRLDEVLCRAEAYADAGADGLFVPWLFDLDTLKRISTTTPLPVNAGIMPGGPTVAELAGAGVRRISLGSWLAQTAMAVTMATASDALQRGTFDRVAEGLAFDAMNSLLPAEPANGERPTC